MPHSPLSHVDGTRSPYVREARECLARSTRQALQLADFGEITSLTCFCYNFMTCLSHITYLALNCITILGLCEALPKMPFPKAPIPDDRSVCQVNQGQRGPCRPIKGHPEAVERSAGCQQSALPLTSSLVVVTNVTATATAATFPHPRPAPLSPLHPAHASLCA